MTHGTNQETAQPQSSLSYGVALCADRYTQLCPLVTCLLRGNLCTCAAELRLGTVASSAQVSRVLRGGGSSDGLSLPLLP